MVSLMGSLIISSTICLCYDSGLKVQSESESRIQLFATPWTIQSLEFSRPEYWSG